MAKIGFIGLGAMGLCMARNLLLNGHKVIGFDFSKVAMDAHVENGGEKEESADNESNVNVESKMEVSAPVVDSPAPLPGPVDKSSPQQVNETKETEDNGEDSLGLDDGVETF